MRSIKKICAFLLTIFILILLCSCESINESTKAANSAVRLSGENVKKSEAVFISLSSNGTPEIITVSDRLSVSEKGGYIDDISILKNIFDITNGKHIKNETGKLRWFMNGNDLFYTGEANMELPLDISVEYYLNGKHLSPNEIKDKSGRSEIKINFKNKKYRKAVIGEKEYTVFLPLVVVGAMVLPNENFSNIQAENAFVFGDEKREYAVFVSFPGMGESLGINELVSSDIVISAETKNFKMNEIYFAALPVDDFSFSSNGMTSDAKDVLSLVKAFSEAVEKANKNGVLSELFSNDEKISELVSCVDSAAQIYDKNSELFSLLSDFSNPEKVKIFENAVEMLNRPEVKTALEVICDEEILNALSEMPSLTEDMEKISPFLAEIRKNMSNEELKSEIENLPATLSKLSNILDIIEKNGEEINAISSLFSKQNSDIFSFVQRLDKAELNELSDKYSFVIDDGETFLTLCEAWLDLGSDYGLYSGNTPEQETSIVFVFKCAPVS